MLLTGSATFPLSLRATALMSVASGLLYFLAFPGVDAWPLSFVALVPLIVALRGQTPKRAWFIGWLAGFTPDARERLRDAASVFAGLRQASGMPIPELVRLIELELRLDIELAANESRGPARIASAQLRAFVDEVHAFLSADDCPCAIKLFPRLPREIRKRLIERLPPLPGPGPDPDPFRRTLAVHERDRLLEGLTVTAAREAGLEPPVREEVTLVPSKTSLAETKGIEDPVERSQVRAEAIRKQVAEQPLRRTVTGSFRVH